MMTMSMIWIENLCKGEKLEMGSSRMFKKTYKNKEMFFKWLLLLPKVDENFEKIDSLTCPYCGKKEIDYLYIGSKKDMMGYLQIWCNSCNHGVYVSRAKIPESAKMIEFNDNSIDLNTIIPEYIEIIPE